MAKVNIEELIEYLRVAGAEEKDIPTWVMTAYYESNFDSIAQNEKTNALGIFQINADRFYDGDEPDPTLKSWFGGNELTLKEFETELEDPQYNTSFAIHYYNVIKEDIEQDGTSQFPDVAANGNDPFAQWEGYLLYVKPYLEGELPKGRGENAESKLEDMIGGIKSYTDAYYSAGLETEGKGVIPKPEVGDERPKNVGMHDMLYRGRDPETGELIRRGDNRNLEKIKEIMEEKFGGEAVTLYNEYNQPELVDKSIAEDIVNNTDWTYESKETNPFKGGALINKFPDTNKKLSEFDDKLQKNMDVTVDEVKDKASKLFGPARNFYALLKDLTSVVPGPFWEPTEDEAPEPPMPGEFVMQPRKDR